MDVDKVATALLVMLKARTLGIPVSRLDLDKITPDWIRRAKELLAE